MIKGVHTMFYTSEPEALRAFLRDKIGFPFTDVGDGWLALEPPGEASGVESVRARGELVGHVVGHRLDLPGVLQGEESGASPSALSPRESGPWPSWRPASPRRRTTARR